MECGGWPPLLGLIGRREQSSFRAPNPCFVRVGSAAQTPKFPLLCLSAPLFAMNSGRPHPQACSDRFSRTVVRADLRSCFFPYLLCELGFSAVTVLLLNELWAFCPLDNSFFSLLRKTQNLPLTTEYLFFPSRLRGHLGHLCRHSLLNLQICQLQFPRQVQQHALFFRRQISLRLFL